MMNFAFSALKGSLAARSAATRAACTLLAAAALGSGLAGCFPLVVGGVAVGSLMVADRRTAGSQVEDEGIELRSVNRIYNELGDQLHVNVTSYNRVVLLTGQVFTQADRDLVENTARTLPNARYIVNEVSVGNLAASTPNDALTSARVKTALVGSRNVRSNAVKVTTENGVVYLMGIVTQQESDRAAAVASGVSGVQKVVKVFEIVGDAAINNSLPMNAVPTHATPVAPAAPYPSNVPANPQLIPVAPATPTAPGSTTP